MFCEEPKCHLHNNNISEKGASAMGEALKVNRGLRHLRFGATLEGIAEEEDEDFDDDEDEGRAMDDATVAEEHLLTFSTRCPDVRTLHFCVDRCATAPRRHGPRKAMISGPG